MEGLEKAVQLLLRPVVKLLLGTLVTYRLRHCGTQACIWCRSMPEVHSRCVTNYVANVGLRMAS